MQKVKRLYFFLKLQFTTFGQILFYLHEFQIVSDILGHPAQSVLFGKYTNRKNCLTCSYCEAIFFSCNCIISAIPNIHALKKS